MQKFKNILKIFQINTPNLLQIFTNLEVLQDELLNSLQIDDLTSHKQKIYKNTCKKTLKNFFKFTVN